MLDKNLPILNHEEPAPIVTTDKANSLAKKAAVIEESDGKSYEESKQKYQAKADILDEQGIRDDVNRHYQEENKNGIIAQMQANLAQQTVEDTANYLRDLAIADRAEVLLEEKYIEKLKKYRSPEMMMVADANQDIYQRQEERLVEMQRFLSLREKYINEEEEEGFFSETLDFIKVLTLVPNLWDNFIGSGGSTHSMVASIRTELFRIKNLPPEERDEAMAALGPWIQDRHNNLFGLWKNPQDVEDTLALVYASPEDLDSDMAWAAADFMFLGATAKWILSGSRAVEGAVKGRRAFKPGESKQGEFVGPPTFDDTFVGPRTPEVAGPPRPQDAGAREQATVDMPEGIDLPSSIPGGQVDTSEIQAALEAKVKTKLTNTSRKKLNKEIKELQSKVDNAKGNEKKRLERQLAASVSRKVSDDEAIAAEAQLKELKKLQAPQKGTQKTPLAQAISENLGTGHGTTGPVKFETVSTRSQAGSKAVAEDIVTGQNKITNPKDVPDQVPTMQPPSSWMGGLSPWMAQTAARLGAQLNTIIGNAPTPQRLGELMEKAKTQFEATYPGHGVLGASRDSSTGLMRLDIGRSTDEAFESKEEALKAIDDMGLNEMDELSNVIPLQTPDGWKVSVTHKNVDALDDWEEMGFIGRNLGNITDVVPGLARLMQQSDDLQRGLTSSIDKLSSQYLKRMLGKKGRKLRGLIEEMQAEHRTITNADGSTREIVGGRWWSIEEFAQNYSAKYGKPISERDMLAYVHYRQLEDYGYMMKVKAMSADVVSRGDKMYSITNPVGEGMLDILGHKINKAVMLGADKNRDAIVVMGDNPRYFARGTMTADDIKNLDDFDILEINPSHRQDMYNAGFAEAPVQYIAVPKGAKSRDFIPTDVANYLGGGRLVNTSPFFIKVGGVVKDSSGDTIRLNDATLYGASDAKSGKLGVKQLNELVDLMKANVDDLSRVTDDAIRRIGLKVKGLNTVEGAKKWMDRNNLWRSGLKIDLVGDREMVNLGDMVKMRDIDKPAVSNSMRSQIFGERTTGVENILGVRSSYADPVSAMARSLDLVHDFVATGAVRERAMAYFRREFGNDLIYDDKNPLGILTAEVKTGVPVGRANMIRAHQKYLADMARVPSKGERGWSDAVERMFNKVFDMKDESFFGKGRAKWSAEKTRDVLERRQGIINFFGNNPGQKLRTLTFHTTLGMLSPASFIMQWVNVANIIAISPRAGALAAAQALPLRAAIYSRDGKVLDMVAAAHKTFGFKSADEVKELVEEAWLRGIDAAGNNSVHMFGINGLQMASPTRKTASNMSAMFVNQGEILNRLTAFITARHEYKRQFKGASIKTPEAREWMSRRTHDLTLGMSRSDIQLGLRSVPASVMFQFWSFPLRLTSALMPKMAGGSKAFTGWEKGRLAAMNVALWGGAGIPLVGYFADWFVENHDMSHEQAKLLSNGLFDYSLYAMSGGEIDSNMSDRVGLHGFYKAIFDAFQDRKFFEVIGGATAGRAYQIAGSSDYIGNMLAAAAYNDPSAMADIGMKAFASLFSSANLAQRTYLGMVYGKLYNKNGQEFASISQEESLLMFLGVPPQAYANRSLQFELDAEEVDAKKLFSEAYLRTMRNYAEAETDEERAEITKTLNQIGAMAHEAGVQYEAFNSALNSLGGADWATKKTQQFQKKVLKGKQYTPGEWRRAVQQMERERNKNK